MEKARFLLFRVLDINLGVPPAQVRRVSSMDGKAEGVRSLADELRVPGDGSGRFLLETSNGGEKWEVGWVSGVRALPLKNIYPIPKLLEGKLHPAFRAVALFGGAGVVWLLDLDELR